MILLQLQIWTKQDIREKEKFIQEQLVRNARMPRKDFLASIQIT